MYTLGIILKFWNEEVLLPLWLKQMELLNFHKLYLCDDGSTDLSAKIAQEWINYGERSPSKAEYIQLEPEKDYYFTELTAESIKVNDMLKKAYDDGCDWVLCLDADEFLSTQLIEYITNILQYTPPFYGVYLPILDLVNRLDQFIITNKDTGFNHFPCPHLKIFGKHSGWVRSVHEKKLDMGVEGGATYIMINNTPYIHLKYLFKNRRVVRGATLKDPIHKKADRAPRNITVASIDEKIFPDFLLEWWKNWDEPGYTW